VGARISVVDNWIPAVPEIRFTREARPQLEVARVRPRSLARLNSDRTPGVGRSPRREGFDNPFASPASSHALF
jgi:hypothetical protein